MQRHRRREPAERGRIARRRLLVEDEIDAEETEREAEPLPRRDALAEEAVGNGRRQHRLQADDERGKPGGDAVFDRNEHAAEVEPVHHKPGQDAVKDTGAVGPFRPGQRDDEDKQRDHRAHPQREKRQRLDISETKFRADKPRCPEQDENARRREDCGIFQRSRHVLEFPVVTKLQHRYRPAIRWSRGQTGMTAGKFCRLDARGVADCAVI